MSNISKKERLELNALSTEVFGTSSRWQKFVDKGYKEMVTEDKIEIVPPAKEGDEPTTKTVQVPVLTEFGSKRFGIKRYTVESIKEFMLKLKKQMDDIRALIQKQQEERKAAEEAKNKVVQTLENSTGSAKG